MSKPTQTTSTAIRQSASQKLGHAAVQLWDASALDNHGQPDYKGLDYFEYLALNGLASFIFHGPVFAPTTVVALRKLADLIEKDHIE